MVLRLWILDGWMPGFSSFTFGYTLQEIYWNRDIWLTYWLFLKTTVRHPNTETKDKLLINFRHPEIAIMRIIRGGADKSLARSTSRCRRTESIVTLERGICSCAELQVFSCYRGWKEACQATRAVSTTWRRELSSIFFLLQGKAPKEIHSTLTETLGEHAPSYDTVKNWVAQFKRGVFFHLWCASSWTTQNIL